MKLNALGYGKPDSGLQLDLVYNPIGGFLPPEQVRVPQAQQVVRLNPSMPIPWNLKWCFALCFTSCSHTLRANVVTCAWAYTL